MKWCPEPIKHVQGPLPAHDRPKGALEHPGEVPGRPGTVRRPRRGPHRGPQRAFARGAPARRVAADRGEAQRPIALLARGPAAVAALHVAGEGRHAGRRGPHSPAARHPPAGGARQDRHARRWRRQAVRGMGPRTLRRVRAHAGGRAADAVREAVGARSLAVHVSVLVDEVAFVLRPRHGGWLIDGTVGMGGHAEALLERSGPDVRLLGLDADPAALALAGARLARFGERVRLVHATFADLGDVAAAHGLTETRGVLLDLGVSSLQLEDAARGFSFQLDGPLDMRLDPTRGETAAALLNRLPETELGRLLHEYGEGRFARRIARSIVRRRPLLTTGDLVAAVRAAVPRAAWPRRLHVATRTFQAVRMAVNDEPDALRRALEAGPRLLAPGGRLGVIAFHSGEDRIVKQTFRSLESAGYAALEPSPVEPADDEVRANPRARSAKLRVLERLP